MLSGIRETLIISTPHDLPLYQELLGDGSQFGIKLNYAVQTSPRGLPEAFIIAEEFLDNSPSTLILGDNIFFGAGLQSILEKASHQEKGMGVFAYPVHDPREYGVVEADEDGCVLSIEEKPQQPKSNLALTGLYFCDEAAPQIAKGLKPSKRGELEIVDLMQDYLKQDQLKVHNFGRGAAWLDTGSPDSLLDAANFVATIERRQGLKIACLEEIAYTHKWISVEELLMHFEYFKNSSYAKYIHSIIEGSHEN